MKQKRLKKFKISNKNFFQVPNLEAIKKDEIPTVLPDISIAYKLHLECGRLINLFDWLQVIFLIN